MVEPKELRLGNWIAYKGDEVWERLVRVTGILENKVFVTEENGSLPRSVSRFYPIQLSLEVLEQCGFDCTGGEKYLTYEKDGFVLSNQGQDGAWIMLILGMVASYNPIKSLHNLQNLYFNHTGDELEVKVTDITP